MLTEPSMDAQPDSSITFISPKNKRVWAGKRRKLARHDEVLDNVARQAGVPPLPQSRVTRIYRRYTSCAGVGALLSGIFVLGLAIAWFIAVEFWRYLGDRAPTMCTAAGIALLLLYLSIYTQKTLDQLVYPPCVLQLYQQLIKSGQLTSGEVQSTEMLAEAKYLIRYQFTLPTSNQSITGQYVTDRPFPVGTKMAVIYLDANCHALL
jgi:hypothetical protein